MRESQSSNMTIAGIMLASLAVPVLVARTSVGEPTRAASAQTLVETSVSAPADPDALPLLSPSAPDQAGIARFVSESWENERVFDRSSNWRTFDPFVTNPSLNDQIRWGRRDCEQTVGDWSLWSVGGGSVGATWGCGSNYPSPLPNRPTLGIRTELQYLYLNLLAVPPEGGLRITFDFKARMPQNALFVGAGDFDNANPDGSIPIRGRNDMTANTFGDWVRGHVVEVRNDQSSGFVITGKSRVLFAFVYSDPPPGGRGVPSTGSNGVFIDNVHLDAMILPNPPIIASPPTPTGPPTATETPTPTPTGTGIVFPTDAPTVLSAAHMPISLKKHDIVSGRVPIPTAPTATVTQTRPPTDTATPEPTLTPTDPPPATITPRPSNTPVPRPDVVFSVILPLDDPEVVRVINQGTAPQDMTSWRVFEVKNTRNCYFPDGLILGPNETFEFQSGRQSSPGPGISVCDPARLMWDNNRDEGQLWNERSDRVDRWCYDRFGPIPCSEPSPTP